jgi:hypothetical protein
MAAERAYGEQQPEEALAGLFRQRAVLLTVLEGTSEAQWQRLGLRDGLRRVSVFELVEDIHRHDQTHVHELHELAAEMGGPVKDSR